MKRVKKAQQLFIELHIKHGTVARFWNNIKVVRTVRGTLKKKGRQLTAKAVRTLKKNSKCPRKKLCPDVQVPQGDHHNFSNKCEDSWKNS